MKGFMTCWFSQKAEDPIIKSLDVGDALEVNGHGTGGAVADMDGDGQVELLLSHGESASEPLTLYNVNNGKTNNYIRYLVFFIFQKSFPVQSAIQFLVNLYPPNMKF